MITKRTHRLRTCQAPYYTLVAPPSLRPAVSAVLVRANVIQSHLLFGSTRLRLEKDRLAMMTLGAGMLLGPRQRRIGNDVCHNVRQLAVNKVQINKYTQHESL